MRATCSQCGEPGTTEAGPLTPHKNNGGWHAETEWYHTDCWAEWVAYCTRAEAGHCGYDA